MRYWQTGAQGNLFRNDLSMTGPIVLLVAKKARVLLRRDVDGCLERLYLFQKEPTVALEDLRRVFTCFLHCSHLVRRGTKLWVVHVTDFSTLACGCQLFFGETWFSALWSIPNVEEHLHGSSLKLAEKIRQRQTLIACGE